MNLIKGVAGVCACAVLLALCGCVVGIEDRIEERAELFSTYDADLQARIRAGKIKIGDSPDVVWFCIGGPKKKIKRETSTGVSEIWSYSISGIQEVGPAYQPVTYYSRTRTGRVIQHTELIYSPTWYPTEVETLRLVFEQGKLAEIEQTL